MNKKIVKPLAGGGYRKGLFNGPETYMDNSEKKDK